MTKSGQSLEQASSKQLILSRKQSIIIYFNHNRQHSEAAAYLSALPYVESEMVMSYAEMDLAIVPAAAPTLKNHLATSCPAPISARTPYHKGFKFTSRACKGR